MEFLKRWFTGIVGAIVGCLGLSLISLAVSSVLGDQYIASFFSSAIRQHFSGFLILSIVLFFDSATDKSRAMFSPSERAIKWQSQMPLADAFIWGVIAMSIPFLVSVYFLDRVYNRDTVI